MQQVGGVALANFVAIILWVWAVRFQYVAAPVAGIGIGAEMRVNGFAGGGKSAERLVGYKADQLR